MGCVCPECGGPVTASRPDIDGAWCVPCGSFFSFTQMARHRYTKLLTKTKEADA